VGKELLMINHDGVVKMSVGTLGTMEALREFFLRASLS
jgi:hypothetical protein